MRGDTVGEDPGMTLPEVIEAVQRYYLEFYDHGWYGEVLLKFQAGRCLLVEARPIMRHYDRQENSTK